MADVDKVRILVVGDSGVGKSSLVHLICHDEPLTKSSWTVGCSVDVKLHETTIASGSSKMFCVELWDIGGFSGHKSSRSVFYQPTHGLILVHDLTNWKSHANLSKWLLEVTNGCTASSNDLESISTDQDQVAAGNDLFPILVVGTKQDQVGTVSVLPRRSALIEKTGADSINVDCLNDRQFSPGSTHWPILSSFFDKVIASRFSSRSSTLPDRRRGTSFVR